MIHHLFRKKGVYFPNCKCVQRYFTYMVIIECIILYDMCENFSNTKKNNNQSATWKSIQIQIQNEHKGIFLKIEGGIFRKSRNKEVIIYKGNT